MTDPDRKPSSPVNQTHPLYLLLFLIVICGTICYIAYLLLN